MDASLKQRLVGAAVLVALAVIFLPMLIGGPGTDTGEAKVSTEIPDRNGHPLETRKIPLPSPVPPSAGAGEDAGLDDNRVVMVDQTGAPQRVDALSKEPVGGGASAPAPTPAPAPAATPTTPPTPAAGTSTPPTAAPATPPTRPAPTTTGRWAVNLGSYANAGNASALVAQLRDAKLPAYSESIALDGKPVQRVRVGPFAQRSEAESARLSVLQIRKDVATGVISLDGEKAPAAVKPAVAEGFAVQIGALRTQNDANALRDRARAAGFASYVERTATDDGVWWRVRIGPELKRANAERLKGEVKAKLAIDGNVVTHP